MSFGEEVTVQTVHLALEVGDQRTTGETGSDLKSIPLTSVINEFRAENIEMIRQSLPIGVVMLNEAVLPIESNCTRRRVWIRVRYSGLSRQLAD